MTSLWLRSLWLVLAGALFFGSIGLVAAWAPEIPVEELRQRWAPPPSRFVEVQGQQVHLRDEGPHDDPAPLVLLHATASSLHTWQGWADGLRGQRRVIRFDLPGSGLTGPAPGDDYSIERSVAFVRAVADQLGVDRFVLAGNSHGGEIAWAAAAMLPHRVHRLVLIDATGYRPESLGLPQEVPIAFRLAQLPMLRTLASYILPRGVVERSLQQVYGDPALATPQLVDRYTAMARRAGNREALARRLAHGAPADLALLKEIKAPTLILWGGRDRVLPPELGRRFAREIPGAQLVVLDGLGHMPQEEDPQQSLAEVRRFLGS